jgi:hypothetical protein
VAAALLFVVAPGHAAAWFPGLPAGLTAFVVLALVVFAWAGAKNTSANLTPATAVLVILTLAKLAMAATAPSTGWLGRYYANGEFAGEPRRSTAFARLADATRIDPVIDFHDDLLPVYFLNEVDFNRGMRREVTEPVSIAWTGHVHTDTPAVFHLSAETRGSMRVAIDGSPAFEAATDHPAARAVEVAAGDHVIEVRYLKPANTDPLVRFTGMAAVVTPLAVAPWRLALATPIGIAAPALDVTAVAIFGYALWMMCAGAAWSAARVAAAAMLLLLIAQGVQAAMPLRQHALSLSGGDDWLGFEARARAVATGDILQLYGQPLGKGDVFYYYPGYSYFLAAVHAIGSEDLSTPIFANFLLLFGANVIVFGLAVRVFGRRAAFGAALFLLTIEELAFIRHYTVTLLSENLYFFSSAVTIGQLVAFVVTQRRRHLVWAGIAGGLSSLARPAMMMYLGPAALIVGVISLRTRRDGLRAATAVACLCAAWLAAVLPATARNYVAAGAPVLISTSPTASFINYNMPPNVDPRVYRDQYLSGSASAITVLARIVVDHPADSLRGIGVKLGFSMGLLQLMGGHFHPELFAASAGYFLALLLCPAARSMTTWPIHAFVLAHLAGMVLTMPSNYGYRLILPMYLFFPMFAVHFLLEASRWTSTLFVRRHAMTPASRSAS